MSSLRDILDTCHVSKEHKQGENDFILFVEANQIVS